MVKSKILALLTVTMAMHLSAWSQHYDVSDTLTEYPMKGTFYHNKFEGRKTSCGEIFDQNLFTAAHWKIKMGTYVLVTNQRSGLQVIVKINDRCPKRGVLDMTRRAANAIGIKGCQPVRVRILPPGYEEHCLAQDTRFDSVPSRFARGQYALGKTVEKPINPKPKNTTKNVSTPQKATNRPTNTIPNSNQYYNVVLGTAHSHGEAFEMIKKLPEPYQDKTIIDSTDSESFTLILEVKLVKKKAQELSRALKHNFRDCQIAPSE